MLALYSAFEKQPEEKKELIIRVAMEEFVTNGYEKASTDTITRRAGISKGILFHYFKSKKNLYLYLVSYARDKITNHVMEGLRTIQSDDFFERIKQIVLIKQHVTAKYLRESQLIADAFTHPPKAVEKEMEEIWKEHYKTYGEEFMLQHVYLKELIQIEKLRDGVSVEKVINMTKFIVEQLTNKYISLYKNKQFDIVNNPDAIVNELSDYLQIMKYGIYKQD